MQIPAWLSSPENWLAVCFRCIGGGGRERQMQRARAAAVHERAAVSRPNKTVNEPTPIAQLLQELVDS